jgi:hypothetical protein
MTIGKREAIDRACKLCNGTHVDFNQGWSGVKNQRLLSQYYNDKSQSLEDKIYIGGMCHPMSMYWLVNKKQGKSFFEWLKPAGKWNKGAINVLVVKTGMYKNNKNNYVPASDHADFDKRFFSNYGLMPKGKTVKGADNVLKHLEQAPTGFHMISLSRQGGGHQVAAYVSADGHCAFFDPNYGEFAFSMSGYSSKYTKQQSIQSYA